MFTYVTLRVLHVAFAAVWFGLPLGNPGALKRALGSDVGTARNAVFEASRRGMISGIFGVLTFLSGLAIIFHMGGFAGVHRNIHTSLGLIVIMLAISFFVMKPTAQKLQGLLDAPDVALPSEAATGLVKRLTIFHGILQALWLVILVLMFWR